MASSSALVSPARQSRRTQIVEAARALVGSKVGGDFDPFRAPLCAIDVVMVAGSPWLKDGLERDFQKDEPGYLKLGGSSNRPAAAYFHRSGSNLIHYLKRSGFYVPRGGHQPAAMGMACFFDWADRGRFNFTPDRSAIIIDMRGEKITRVVVALPSEDHEGGFVAKNIAIKRADRYDQALIGYSDLP